MDIDIFVLSALIRKFDDVFFYIVSPPGLSRSNGASGFAMQATPRQVAQDAEHAEFIVFSFDVDPPKIPADRKDGKRK